MRKSYHLPFTKIRSGFFTRVMAVIFFTALVFPTEKLAAQDKDNTAKNNAAHETENRLRKAANRYFEDGNFIEAYPLYSQLLSLYPRDPNYNYRFGACMLFTKADKNKAVEYLSFSVRQTSVDNLAYYYLGRALHLNYRFNEAIRTYRKFEQIAAPSELKKYPVRHYIDMCVNGKELISNLHGLNVLRKKELNLADYFEAYDMHSNGGTLLSEPESFKTKTDKDKGGNNVIYLTPDKKHAYFSSYGSSEKNGKDIYFVSRKPDGSWGTPENLGSAINSAFDEDYPVYDVPRHTLYFCSKGHNSMGGYDIFKSVYDEITNKWSEPVNLDFPINTPDDDILFVPDTVGQTAFFSSTRSSPEGTIDVYKIAINIRMPETMVIDGNAYSDDGKTPVLCKITVKNNKTNEVVGTYVSSSDDGKYSFTLPNGGSYNYTVEASNHKTQSQPVIFPSSQNAEAMKQDIHFDESGNLQIKSHPTEISKDSDYQLAFNFIKDQAQMDVNVDTTNIQKLMAEAAANNANSSSSNPGSNDNGANSNASSSSAGNNSTPSAPESITQLQQEKEVLDDKAAKAIDYAGDKMEEAQQLQQHANEIVKNQAVNSAKGKNQDSIAAANNLIYQSKGSEEKGIEAYQLAAEYKSEAASKQIEIDKASNTSSENANSGNSNSEASTTRISPGDLIRRQAEQVKEDSFQVARANDDLVVEVNGLQNKSQEYITQAGQANDQPQKTALLQQADDLKKSKDEKQAEIQENNNALQQMHQESSWLKSKAEKADSVYTARVNAGDNKASTVNNTSAQPGLQQEIDDYTAAHKTNYDSLSTDTKTVNNYPGDVNGGNTNQKNEIVNSTTKNAGHSKHSRYGKNIHRASKSNGVASSSTQGGSPDNSVGGATIPTTNNPAVAAITNGNIPGSNENNPSTGNNNTPVNSGSSGNTQNNNSTTENGSQPVTTNGNSNSGQPATNNASSANGNNTSTGNPAATNSGNKTPFATNGNNNSTSNNPQVNNSNSGSPTISTANGNNSSAPVNPQPNKSNTGSPSVFAANGNNNSSTGNPVTTNSTSGNNAPAITNGNNSSSSGNPVSTNSSSGNNSPVVVNNNSAQGNPQTNSTNSGDNNSAKSVNSDNSSSSGNPATSGNPVVSQGNNNTTTENPQPNNPVASNNSNSATPGSTSGNNNPQHTNNVTKNNQASNSGSDNGSSTGSLQAGSPALGNKNSVAANNSTSPESGNSNSGNNSQGNNSGNDQNNQPGNTSNPSGGDANSSSSGQKNNPITPNNTSNPNVSNSIANGNSGNGGDVNNTNSSGNNTTVSNPQSNTNSDVNAVNTITTAKVEGGKNAGVNKVAPGKSSGTKNNSKGTNQPSNSSNTQGNNSKIAGTTNNSDNKKAVNNPDGGNETVTVNDNQATKKDSVSNKAKADSLANVLPPAKTMSPTLGYKKTTTPHDALLDSLANAVPKPKPEKLSAKQKKLQAAQAVTTVQYTDTAAAGLSQKAQNYFTAASSLVDIAEKIRSKAQGEKDKAKSEVLYNKADSLDDLIFQLNLKGDETVAEANYRQYYTNLDQIEGINVKPDKGEVYKVTAAKRMLKDADNSYRRSMSERDRANNTPILANKHAYIKSAKQDLATAILRQQSAVYLYFQVDSDQTASTMGKANSDSSMHFTYSDFIKNKSKKSSRADRSFMTDNTTKTKNPADNPGAPATENNTNKTTSQSKTPDNSSGKNGTSATKTTIASTKTTNRNKKKTPKEKPITDNNVATAPSNSTPAAGTSSDKSNTTNSQTSSLAENGNIFEEVRRSPYSASNPIPIDPPLPMGLIFKVQVGAFKNAIPQNLFQGFQPIIGLSAPEGYIRYSAGMFRLFDVAKDALGKIRALGYPDAFLIAFYDGKRITIAEALSKLGITVPPPVATNTTTDNAGGNTTQPAVSDGGAGNENAGTTTTVKHKKKKTNGENSGTEANSNTEGNVTSSGDNKVVVIGENTIIPSKKTLIDERKRASKKIKDTIPPNAKSLENVNGLVYTVQVGSFPKHKDFTRLKKLKQLYTSVEENGAIKYSCGTYATMDEAKTAKEIIMENSSAKDAFITAYFNGKRISLTKASELSKKTGNAETKQPVESAKNTSKKNPDDVKSKPAVVTEAKKDNTDNGEGDNATDEKTTTKEDNGSFVEASKNKVIYTVQIASFTGELPLDIANKILMYADEGIEPHSEKHGVTSYYAGKFTGYDAANTLQQKLYNEGFQQAVIVAYYQGRKISLQQAQSINNK